MKRNIIKNSALTAIQLIILLFTVTYGISTFAGEKQTNKAITQEKMIGPSASPHMLLAKGQPYVPPKNNVHDC